MRLLVFLEVSGKVAEPAGEAFAAQCLVHGSRPGEAGQGPRDGKGMAAGNQALLEEIVALQHRLIDPAGFIILAAGQQLRQQRQRGGRLLLQHAGGHQQIGLAVRQVAGAGHQLHPGVQRAQRRLDPVLQNVGGVVLRAQLAEAGGEDVQQPQFLQREVGNVKIQIQIDNAVGLPLHLQKLRSGDGMQLGADGRGLLRHVAQLQMGQRSQGLLGVGLLLPLLQRLGLAEHLRRLLFVPGRGSGSHARRLLPGVLLPLGDRGQRIEPGQLLRLGQHFCQQVGEIGRGKLFPQGVKDARVVNVGQGIVAVEPAVQRPDGQLNAVGLADLPAGEGRPVQAGGQRLPVQPLLQQVADALGQQGANGVEGIRAGVAHHQGDIRLVHAVTDVQPHILRQSLLQEGALQRRFIGAGEIVGKDSGGVDFLHVLVGAQDLGGDHMGQRLLTLPGLIVNGALRRDRLLQHEVEVRGAIVVLAEIFAVYVPQGRVHVHMAVQDDFGVGRVIEAGVGIQELPVAQLGNVGGMPAAGVAVAAVREKHPGDFVLHQAVDVGISALHFAVHHAVAAGRLARGVKFVMPALLPEDFRTLIDQRTEDAVEIDGHQVEQVLFAAAGHRIERLVAEGHGIEEGLHGALQQGDERLLDRELPGTVEHAVLQNVEHAGIVFRQSLEADGEGFVFVSPVEIQQLRAGFLVPQRVELRRLGGDIFRFYQPEPGAAVPGPGVCQLACLCLHRKILLVSLQCFGEQPLEFVGFQQLPGRPRRLGGAGGRNPPPAFIFPYNTAYSDRSPQNSGPESAP